MANVINATTGGLVSTGDTVATLNLQTGGATAIAIDTAQTVTISNSTITTLSSTSANITTLTSSSGTITTLLDGSGLVRNIPQNAKTAAYTIATTDNGKYISTQSGTITVPNNTFVAGNVVSVYNDSANTISLTLSTTTAYVAGTDTNRTGLTLAKRGLATVLFINPSACVISGNVT